MNANNFVVGDLVWWRNRCVAVVMNDGSNGSEAYVNVGHLRQEPLVECDRLVTDGDLKRLKNYPHETTPGMQTLYELIEVLAHLIPYHVTDADLIRSRAWASTERLRSMMWQVRP